MAVAMIQEFAIQDHSTTNYDRISERLRSGPPAEGLIFHTAGFDDDAGVFRVFDVWESQEQAEAFQARVMEMIGDMVPSDTPGPTRSAFYKLHDVAGRKSADE
jgi:hypothetical protein